MLRVLRLARVYGGASKVLETAFSLGVKKDARPSDRASRNPVGRSLVLTVTSLHRQKQCLPWVLGLLGAATACRAEEDISLAATDGSSGAAETAGDEGPSRIVVSNSTAASGETGEVESTPVSRHGALSVMGTKLVDAQGQPLQLKGPSSMWLNWESTGYAQSEVGVGFMRDDWGATVIRAAMGIEPNNAYLASPERALRDVRAVVDNAIALGLYVIIDWHDHNAHEHQEEAIEFFSMMAEEYGHTPNVIYEIYNEPLQVDWSSIIKPYHEAVVAAIRAIDTDNVIILGTPNWSQYVDVAANDPVAGDNLMYTLHFYSCTHRERERTRGDRAIAAGVALFVTEWGATHADGGTPANPTLCEDEAQLWHDWMNENGIGWTAWKFDDCPDMSCYFKPGTPRTGDWTDEQLHGHGAFVRDRMRE